MNDNELGVSAPVPVIGPSGLVRVTEGGPGEAVQTKVPDTDRPVLGHIGLPPQTDLAPPQTDLVRTGWQSGLVVSCLGK